VLDGVVGQADPGAAVPAISSARSALTVTPIALSSSKTIV
jgi:hypothetical protein